MLSIGDGERGGAGLADGCAALFLADFERRNGCGCRQLAENIRRQQKSAAAESPCASGMMSSVLAGNKQNRFPKKLRS